MWVIAVVNDVGSMNGSFGGQRIHAPDPYRPLKESIG
jgi:hypothetical protein